MNNEIDKKEIRGINFNLIRSTIVTISTIIFAVAFTYYNLKLGQDKVESSVKEIRSEMAVSNNVFEIRIRTIENELTRQETAIQQLSKIVNKIK